MLDLEKQERINVDEKAMKLLEDIKREGDRIMHPRENDVQLQYVDFESFLLNHFEDLLKVQFLSSIFSVPCKMYH